MQREVYEDVDCIEREKEKERESLITGMIAEEYYKQVRFSYLLITTNEVETNPRDLYVTFPASWNRERMLGDYAVKVGFSMVC